MLLPLVMWAVLQSAPGHPVQAVNPLLADCSGDRNTPGCRSFNERIEARDKTVLQSTSDDSYACFRLGDDVFFLISLHPATHEKGALPLVRYHLFKKGVLDDSRVAYGKSIEQSGGSADFAETKPPPSRQLVINAQSSVTDSEVTVSYTFENGDDTKTEYSVKIGRSTLRFVETYQWRNQKSQGENSNTYSGSCVSYPK
jgi:hypothetical protein